MTYDLAIYIGRFQPVHHGHLDSMRQALERSKYLLILIGSANISRQKKNPLTAEERKHLIIHGLCDMGYDKKEIEKRIIFTPINDYPEDAPWIIEVVEAVDQAKYFIQEQLGKSSLKSALMGYQKDESSYYLNIFPHIQWLPFEAYLHEGKILSATHIRNAIEEKRWIDVKKYVQPSTYEWLLNHKEIWEQ